MGSPRERQEAAEASGTEQGHAPSPVPSPPQQWGLHLLPYSVCILKSFLSAIGRWSHLFLQMTASHSSASLCWIISLKFIICFPSLSPIFLITHSSTFLNHSPPFFLLTPFKLAEGQWHYTSCSPASTTPACIGRVLPQGVPRTPDTDFSWLHVPSWSSWLTGMDQKAPR